VKIERCGREDIFKSIDLQENDVILYLGGRIDDDNLYPTGYRKYLKAKIKSLKPTKIICHNYWYAKKYYGKGILTKHAKIDMVLVHYHHLRSGNFTAINLADYSDHRDYMQKLTEKNPSMVYAIYICQHRPLTAVDVYDEWFGKGYDLNNVKYFTFDRTYSPMDLTEEDLGHGGRTRNASDGFAMLISMVNAGFKNLNILGFSAFGSDEDPSYHTEFGKDSPRFAGRKYFNLGTSEDQLAEADILQYWVKTKKIKNVEDYSKLMFHLKEK
jgi:hypothetical protein